jgi:hypothetical protein
MTVTLTLKPEIEKNLLARAQAHGVSLDEYLQELVAKEASLPEEPNLQPVHGRFKNLSDLLLSSPFAGSDLDLERIKDYPRSLDLG